MSASIPLSQHLSKLRVHKSKKPEPETVRSTTDRDSANNTNNNNKTKSNEVEVRPEDITLPQTFVVKCLGRRDAGGLWGIKHTRKPVDEMVAQARYVRKLTRCRVPFPGLRSAAKLHFRIWRQDFDVMCCEGTFGE